MSQKTQPPQLLTSAALRKKLTASLLNSGSRPTGTEFIPGEYEHNFTLLARLVDEGDMALGRITHTHAKDGKQGSPTKCAVALWARDMFGKGARPRVDEAKGFGQSVRISDYTSRLRYIAPLNKNSVFKPQRYDIEKHTGTIIIRDVKVKKLDEPRHGEAKAAHPGKAKAWKKRTGYKTPKPRAWS